MAILSECRQNDIPPTKALSGKPLNILIIDDDWDDFFVIERMLRRSNLRRFALTHVDNCDDAIEAMTNGDYDVVLLDYHVGERYGTEVVEGIEGVPSLPVIMLTGQAVGNVEKAALDAGVFDFLDKNELSSATLSRSIDFAIRRFEIEATIRESERRLRRAREEADAANSAKSEFLAHMSHELRTPLNAIIGFSEVIKDDIFGLGIDDQYGDYAHKVFDSGKHLLSLINDLLDLSKIEAGSTELHIETLDLHDVIDSAIRLVAGVDDMGATIIVKDVPKSIDEIDADERALTQMIVNLLSNSIKFTPSGTVTITASQTDAGIALSIRDTGVGIAQCEIERALAPFGQATASSQVATKGTGLGLTITKLLIEQHGGELKLSSVLGQGTTVVLQFPNSKSSSRQLTRDRCA